MRAIHSVVSVFLSAVALAFPSSSGIAQQVTAVLGSPSATTTIPGDQIPPPDPKFGGVI
jgi:arylsulfatase